MKTRHSIPIFCIAIFVATSFMVIVYTEPESFGLTKPYSKIGEYDGSASEMALMISEQCLDQKQNQFKDYTFTKTSNGHYYIDNVICERINVEQGGCLEPFSKGHHDETCKNRVTFDQPYGETGPYFSKEFCNQVKLWEPALTDTVENKLVNSEWFHICTIRGLIDDTQHDLEIMFDEDEYSVEYFVMNGNTDHVEIDIPTDMIDGVFMIYINGENVEDKRVSIDGNKVIVNYGQNIESVKLFGSYDLGGLKNENTESLDIASIEDGRIILNPVDTCAGIDIDRLTPEELNQKYPATYTTKSGKTYEIKFLSIDDDDLKEVPVISELIRATHQIPFSLNNGITASKGLVEDPDWIDHLDWYDQKKAEQFNPDEVRVRGFVYNEEYFSIGFSIC